MNDVTVCSVDALWDILLENQYKISVYVKKHVNFCNWYVNEK